MRLLREQCVESRKGHLQYSCNQVWTKKWWADSVECYCYLRNIQDLLADGKTPFERRLGVPFNGPVIPFGAMVDYHLVSAQDLSRLHQFGLKVLPDIFLGYALHAGGIWKERHLGRRHLTDGCIWNLCKKTQCKGSVNANERWKFIVPVADGPVKIPGRDQNLRTSTLIRDSPDTGKEQDILRGESEGSSSTPRQDSSCYILN